MKWGHFEPKGKDGQMITVHIPVYLDGKSPSSLKLCASPATFRELSDHWFHTVSERRLGMLAIKAIRAGGGATTASQGTRWPSSIDVQQLVVGRTARARSIPVTLTLTHAGKEHCLKFLAYRDVFQRLAGFHQGNEASDVRFGYVLRMAMWAACDHISWSEDSGKTSGKLFARIAWKTAAWLGPALLDQMRTAEKDFPDTYAEIQKSMPEELKRTPRNMAAFLVDKNWQNWRIVRRLKELPEIPEWPTRISPIKTIVDQNNEGTGEFGSTHFWDEIFYRQLKLRRFPWPQLRRTNPERFKVLTEPAIEERKARYAQQNPGFDWEQCRANNPAHYNELINEFLEDHMALYPFSMMVRAVPTQGPQFYLPKSFEETVQDILESKDVFLLFP